MLDHVVFPIYSYKEVGSFLEIVHDVLREKGVSFIKIIDICSELDQLFSQILERESTFEINILDSVRIMCKVDFQVKLVDLKESGEGAELSIPFFELNDEVRELFISRQSHKQKAQYVKLLNKSLQDKNEQIQKMYDSKSYLVNFLAHELRNPLMAILNSIELMRTAPEMISTMELDKVLENVAGNMKKLVDDVLDFSKLETNKMEFETQEVEVKTFCAEFAKYGETLTESRELDWKTIGIENLNGATMKVDPFRVRQILSNLVGNALKFTEKGHVAFSAKVEDGKVLLGVHDTGRGIEKKFQSSIFKEFTQESSSISREFGGSGLGLNICYNLCKKMNGDLWFETEAGKGTSFFVGLPLAKQ
ncbi:MAG: hypothetical protein CME64_12240 [Halobacteriovoraceae bacterium]|nr:hypothetical protein [Halobacteriovoraceae bacterium]